MYYYLIYYLIFWWMTFSGASTREANDRLQTHLEQAYKSADYPHVLDYYDSLRMNNALVSPPLLLKIAHAAQNTGDTLRAKQFYEQLTRVKLPKIPAIALNQLGVQAFENGSYNDALNYFKEAIAADPNYETALFNYELVYKKHPPRSGSNVTNRQQIDKDFEQQVTTTPQNNQKTDLLANTVPPRMERERALQLLDALRASEQQEFAQRRYGSGKNPPEKNW